MRCSSILAKVLFREQIKGWLRTQGGRVWRLTYGGHTRLLTEWPRGAASARSVAEIFNAAAATCLAEQFTSQRPDYPSFQGFARSISGQVLEETARAALQAIAGPIATQQGSAVLDALQVLDGSTLRPRGSQYANHILGLLERQGEGQVVNRTALLEPCIDAQGNMLLEEERHFHIEPEWLLVVLMALVASGDLVLVLPGGTHVDAGTLGDATRRPLRELLAYRHIERPKDLPLASLLSLFRLLGLPEGLMRDPNQREDGVRQLQGTVEREIERTLQAQQLASKGLRLWNSAVLEGAVLDEVQRALSNYKVFLERLRPYNTVGKLKNVRLTVEEVEVQTTRRAGQGDLTEFAALLQDLQLLTAYLATAQEVLPPGHPWRSQVQAVQQEQLALLRNRERRRDAGVRTRLLGQLGALQHEYATLYLDLHRAARLGASQDDAKKHLLHDPRLASLRTLALITLLPRAQLESWQADVDRLVPCYGLSADELHDGPICPRCQFRPIEELRTESVDVALVRLENDLSTIQDAWLSSLRDNLQDPIATDSLGLWEDAAIRGSIRAFRDGEPLPHPLPPAWAPAVNTILSGLQRLAISSTDLLAAIGSTPLTRSDFDGRVRLFLDQRLQGQDVRKVRIIVE